ncbi:hypothetical protein HanXRQr2_Chr04g0182421 [Helianthus annuus]|uniref:Uncharacterized protein n=1 Tax=Helianthus annuus TaxID=4232 RepID=A0A9K3JAE8_HELAN|nr:hypothetical protein HanXRQr2_Chr04g0182421 [Helianthus annuus]KAJ0932633.1 hypothetical protein HanPSC8_Chr04g0175871 [Helianthus annuus]
MAVIRPLSVAMAVMLAVLLSIVSPCVEAQSFAPAPAPTSDGKLLISDIIHIHVVLV